MRWFLVRPPSGSLSIQACASLQSGCPAWLQLLGARLRVSQLVETWIGGASSVFRKLRKLETREGWAGWSVRGMHLRHLPVLDGCRGSIKRRCSRHQTELLESGVWALRMQDCIEILCHALMQSGIGKPAALAGANSRAAFTLFSTSSKLIEGQSAMSVVGGSWIGTLKRHPLKHQMKSECSSAETARISHLRCSMRPSGLCSREGSWEALLDRAGTHGQGG
jgi:hypothetical protein